MKNVYRKPTKEEQKDLLQKADKLGILIQCKVYTDSLINLKQGATNLDINNESAWNVVTKPQKHINYSVEVKDFNNKYSFDEWVELENGFYNRCARDDESTVWWKLDEKEVWQLLNMLTKSNLKLTKDSEKIEASHFFANTERKYQRILKQNAKR